MGKQGGSDALMAAGGLGTLWGANRKWGVSCDWLWCLCGFHWLVLSWK